MIYLDCKLFRSASCSLFGLGVGVFGEDVEIVVVGVDKTGCEDDDAFLSGFRGELGAGCGFDSKSGFDSE